MTASPNNDRGLKPAGVCQIAMWEEYAGKLEEQLRALVQDNQLLQGALQAVRTSLASGQPASPASTGIQMTHYFPTTFYIQRHCWREGQFYHVHFAQCQGFMMTDL